MITGAEIVGRLGDIPKVLNAEHVEQLILALFDEVVQHAGPDAAMQYNLHNNDEKVFYRTLVLVGLMMWEEAAKVINSLNIKVMNADGNTSAFILDLKGFILCLLMLEPSVRENYVPYIEEAIDAELGDEYREAVKDGSIHQTQPAPKVDEETVFIPISEVTDENLIGEYFRTFKALGQYRSSGEYDSPRATELYNRMNALYARCLKIEI